MAHAQQGDRVIIDFTGTLSDGTVFDSTIETGNGCSDECDADEHASGDCGCGCGEGPMELTIGAGQLFPQIEEALVGMSPGEKKKVMIPAAEAFGEVDDEKIFTVPRSNLPEGFDPQVGEEMVLSNDEDEEMGVAVIEVTDREVTFNANHPLAGEDLTYELQLVQIL
ncbi:peptidylprolyl isomerase [Geobacter sp. DSM 9736]|uniref:FKBP-type peptidyl-prolyl cis-trans isomerase n=1 Tax=Geobacter sp. DSM 9736 TaxID=1277350 RepID=UPI000B50DA74|nr:peptidylprolyl isomerase [Geobacter sp. DSM 9736]SNB47361.1 peptidylprolyl isomerase [Geobacter sp. DSM 9736]